MKRERFFLSTIDANGHRLAEAYGLGLEIAEYCTAWNLDREFAETDARVQKKIAGLSRRILHGPFNELFPCAIDPMARDLAAFRYQQALDMAVRYGASKLVLHGGYNPRLYYPVWYTEQSILFWKAFLEKIPDGVVLCLENVFEEEPEMLLDIVKAVNSPKLRLCLDVGHIHAYSRIPPEAWLKTCEGYLSHFHLHNNDGDLDSHRDLFAGKLPMKKLLLLANNLCPEATFTLEIMDSEESVKWLLDQQMME